MLREYAPEFETDDFVSKILNKNKERAKPK